MYDKLEAYFKNSFNYLYGWYHQIIAEHSILTTYKLNKLTASNPQHKHVPKQAFYKRLFCVKQTYISFFVREIWVVRSAPGRRYLIGFLETEGVTKFQLEMFRGKIFTSINLYPDQFM